MAPALQRAVVILLPFFALPLAMAITLMLTLGGNWANKTSEQVRLDAVTLSICHHRKNFILSEIVKPNRVISGIQRTMDAIALPCFAAVVAGGPIGALSVCRGVRAELETLSKIGARIQNLQDLKRAKYFLGQKSLRDKLAKENELGENSGKLHLSLPVVDGFSREPSSSVRRPLEILFRINWPNILRPDSSFDLINNFTSEFRPDRILVGGQKAKWDGVTNTKTFANSGRSAISRSGCRIINLGANEFKVMRTL